MFDGGNICIMCIYQTGENDMNNGLIIKNGKLYGDKNNSEKAMQFVAQLLKMADEAEKKAIATTAYKAKVLNQNARQARKDADRIEKSLK
jgi:hypothetical protein